MFLLYKSYPDSISATLISVLASGFILVGILCVGAGVCTLFTGDSEEGFGLLVTGAIFAGLDFLLKKGAKKVALRAVRKKAEKAARNQETGNQQNG